MADVFVSYSRKDFRAIERVVRFLEANKISVWWDPAIAPGERFRKAIPDALRQSCCAVVAWSKNSVESDWVLDEAGEARKRGILVPLNLDGTEVPLSFRQHHTVNFAGWRGSYRDDAARQLLVGVQRIIKQQPGKAKISSGHIGRIMHLIDRKAQAHQLEDAFRRALQGGYAASPLIVFTCGCARASFRALVSRFAWYSAPRAQRALIGRNSAPAAEPHILQPKGFILTASAPLSAALEEANEQMLDHLAVGGAVRGENATREELALAMRESIDTAPPVAAFFTLPKLPRSRDNLNEIVRWLAFWNFVRGEQGLKQPIVIFFCVTLPFSPLPFPLQLFSPGARFTRWLRRNLEKRTLRGVRVLVLDELPTIRMNDMREWAEITVPDHEPTATVKVPRLISRLRWRFRWHHWRWHMEDVFELEPLIEELLSSDETGRQGVSTHVV